MTDGARAEVPRRRDKRIFDLLLTVPLALALLPVVGLVWLALSIECRLLRRERASLVYRERRVSGGREFDLLKWRILRASLVDEERARHGAEVAIKHLERDPTNLTVVGSLVKKWYLDELPQLWNVLRGDMSLVGPRPWDVRAHRKGLPSGETVPKELIPCGIVGPVQAEKGRGDLRTEPEWRYLDAYRRSTTLQMIATDVDMLRRSLRTVLAGKGL